MFKIYLAVGNKELEGFLRKNAALIEKNLNQEVKFVGTAVYKEGIIQGIKETHPNVILIREGLPGTIQLTDLVYQIKLLSPTTRIIFLAGDRSPGDAFLATIIQYGVYDVLIGKKVDAKEMLKKIIHPNTFADVAAFMPKLSVDEKTSKQLYEAPDIGLMRTPLDENLPKIDVLNDVIPQDNDTFQNYQNPSSTNVSNNQNVNNQQSNDEEFVIEDDYRPVNQPTNDEEFVIEDDYRPINQQTNDEEFVIEDDYRPVNQQSNDEEFVIEDDYRPINQQTNDEEFVIEDDYNSIKQDDGYNNNLFINTNKEATETDSFGYNKDMFVQESEETQSTIQEPPKQEKKVERENPFRNKKGKKSLFGNNKKLDLKTDVPLTQNEEHVPIPIPLPMDKPYAQEPVIQQPVNPLPMDKPYIQEPIVQQPVNPLPMDKPYMQEPTVQQPVNPLPMDKPYVQEPVVQQPINPLPMDKPYVQEPIVQQPINPLPMDKPYVQEPIVQQPVNPLPMDKPYVQEPIVQQPVTPIPVPIIKDNKNPEQPYNPVYQPGYNPGYQPGYNPGYAPNMGPIIPNQNNEPEKKRGKFGKKQKKTVSQQIVTFMGGRHGCGNTTTAFNVALALAEQNFRVLYLDLDDKFSSSDAIFTFGFQDLGIETMMQSMENGNYQNIPLAINSASKILNDGYETDTKNKIFGKFPNKFEFACFSNDLLYKENYVPNYNPNYLKDVIMFLSMNLGYDMIIIDAPSDFKNVLSQNALLYSNKIFFTLTQDYVDVNNLVANLRQKIFKNMGYQEKVHFIFNKYIGNNSSMSNLGNILMNNLKISEFEMCTLPNVYADAISASNDGVPLLWKVKDKNYKKGISDIIGTIIN